MGTFQTSDGKMVDHLNQYDCCPESIPLEVFDIGNSKYSNFESRQFKSISAKFSDWGLLRSPQSEALD